jgi:hypothetical protein
MSNTDARPSEKKGRMQGGILSTEMVIDLPPIKLLCLSYDQGQHDEWSLPIETVASAFSCHQ